MRRRATVVNINLPTLTHAIQLQGISEVRFFASVAFPALGVAATFQTATRLLIASTAVAGTPLASATGSQRITIKSYITTFNQDRN